MHFGGFFQNLASNTSSFHDVLWMALALISIAGDIDVAYMATSVRSPVCS
jgi:hypothetical protein